MTNSPNSQLLEQYGTHSFHRRCLEKKASLPVLLNVLGPLGTQALLRREAERATQQVYEAEVLNQLFRDLESKRMASVSDGLKGTAPALSAQGRIALGLTDMHAYGDMMHLMKQGSAPQDLDKEAFLGVGRALSVAGKGLSKLVPKAKGTASAVKKGLRPPAGVKAPIKQPVRAKAVAPPVPSRTSAVAPPPRPFTKAPPRPTPPPAAAAAAAASGSGAKKKKSLLGFKGKALATGAVLGTGYAGLKALGGAKDYMMQPTYASNTRGGRGMLGGGVNQYGYQNPY